MLITILNPLPGILLKALYSSLERNSSTRLYHDNPVDHLKRSSLFQAFHADDNPQQRVLQ